MMSKKHVINTYKTDWAALFIISITHLSEQDRIQLSNQDEQHLVELMHQLRDHWSTLSTNAHTWVLKSLKIWGELMLHHEPQPLKEMNWYEHLHLLNTQNNLTSMKKHTLSMLHAYTAKCTHKQSHQALISSLQFPAPTNNKNIYISFHHSLCLLSIIFLFLAYMAIP